MRRCRWGQPNKAQSQRDDIRFGAKGSKSVKPSVNTWHDHETGEGGGYVEMHRATRGELPLLIGVQKEEETWIPVLPLVQWLTKSRIGQLWIDHTARSTGLQYGTSTKSWRFDTAGLMLPLNEDERDPRETAFTLSFDKARRRTPDNWDEFATHIIRLRDDVWTGEPAEKRNGTGEDIGSVPPSRRVFYDALVAAIGKHGQGTAGVPTDLWVEEALRRGLIEKPPEGETSAQRRTRFRDYRTAKSTLLAAKWILIDGDLVIDLRRRWS